MAPNFSSSYMVTNRAYPQTEWSHYIYPLPSGQNYYFTAKGGNNANPHDYQLVNPSATQSMPGSFRTQLEADLQLAVQAGGPQLTLYIHGLGNYFSDACTELGTFGANLAGQGYNGLMIAFSWPSYGEGMSWDYYGSLPYRFPPLATSGSIRDNINGSIESLLNLITMLAAICQTHGATLNVLCHSEGNYMLMLALHQFVSDSASAGPLFGQVLSVAADINTGALQVPSSSPPWAGQGAAIAQLSTGTTVYWSSGDDVLPYSEGWKNYHNPAYPNRLGLHGPASFAVGALMPRVYGLDCSDVVNDQVIVNIPQVPPGTLSHSAYFYIPQVLLDMSQTLAGVPPEQVTNRESAGAPNGQAFRMLLAAETQAGRFTPRGTRLERLVPPGAAPIPGLDLG